VARQLVRLLKESTPNPTPAARMMQGWDATLSRESGVAALYEVWLNELHKVAAKKEGVDSFEDEWSLKNMIEDLSDPSPQVFGADAVAGRNQVLLQTLESAWKQTEQLLGTDPQKWSWGRLHTMQFRHSLDRLPDGATLDLGPLSRPGDGNTVNATWVGKKFEQEGGASYREILDTADWDHSLAVNTPGQSGQPESPHYSDLLPLWDKGEYFPLLYSRKAVEKNARDRLMLAPK
jgi:penicillin amidase